MQREIKFRAWDTVNKRMILEPYIHFVDGESFYLDQRSRGGKMRSDLEIELMQFTGLLDKNGKEIYSGDIVENHPNVRWEVKWSEKKAQWRVGGGGCSDFALCSMGKVEIIGNIYENPELTKKD